MALQEEYCLRSEANDDARDYEQCKEANVRFVAQIKGHEADMRRLKDSYEELSRENAQQRDEIERLNLELKERSHHADIMERGVQFATEETKKTEDELRKTMQTNQAMTKVNLEQQEMLRKREVDL